MLLFTWLDRLKDVLLCVQRGISWPDLPMGLVLWGRRISGKGTSDVGVGSVRQITKFVGAQRFSTPLALLDLC